MFEDWLTNVTDASHLFTLRGCSFLPPFAHHSYQFRALAMGFANHPRYAVFSKHVSHSQKLMGSFSTDLRAIDVLHDQNKVSRVSNASNASNAQQFPGCADPHCRHPGASRYATFSCVSTTSNTPTILRINIAESPGHTEDINTRCVMLFNAFDASDSPPHNSHSSSSSSSSNNSSSDVTSLASFVQSTSLDFGTIGHTGLTTTDQASSYRPSYKTAFIFSPDICL